VQHTSMQFNRKVSRPAALIALISSALLAGCAADGQGQAAPPEEEPSGTINVIHTQQWNLTQMGLDAGLDQGIWEDTGIEVVEITGQEVAQALATGEAEISIDSANRTIPAILDGLDAKIVGATIEAFDVFVLTSPDNPAQSLDDLKGSTFGVTVFGSSGEYGIRKMADSLGWTEDDYEIVPLGTPAASLAAMQEGTIDAMPWSAGGAFKAEFEGKAKVLDSLRSVAPDVPVAVIAVTGDAIRNRPASVKAFCTGFYEMQDRMKADRELTKDLLVRRGEMLPEVADLVIDAELELISTSPAMTDAQIEGMAEQTRYTTPTGAGAKVTAEQVADMYVSCDEI
jgi:ABC-type nitrate/sulfonate/bicarbonate transport system substrate-binding protein